MFVLSHIFLINFSKFKSFDVTEQTSSSLCYRSFSFVELLVLVFLFELNVLLCVSLSVNENGKTD